MNTKLLSSLPLILASMSATAQQPVPGIYWNAQEPGRGFSIDYQNGSGSIVGYVYDEAGNPLWFLTAGPMTENGTRLQGSADVYEGGQCIGCEYSRPEVVDSLGALDLKFTQPDIATLTIDGTVIEIERQNFGFPPAPEGMLGTWHFVSIASRTATAGLTYTFDMLGAPSGLEGGTGPFLDPENLAVGECFVSGDFAGTCLLFDFNPGQTIDIAYQYVLRTDRAYGVAIDTISNTIVATTEAMQLRSLAATTRAQSRSVGVQSFSANASTTALVESFAAHAHSVDPNSVDQLAD